MDCFYCGSNMFAFGDVRICSSCAATFVENTYITEPVKEDSALNRSEEDITNG